MPGEQHTDHAHKILFQAMNCLECGENFCIRRGRFDRLPDEKNTWVYCPWCQSDETEPLEVS